MAAFGTLPRGGATRPVPAAGCQAVRLRWDWSPCQAITINLVLLNESEHSLHLKRGAAGGGGTQQVATETDTQPKRDTGVRDTQVRLVGRKDKIINRHLQGVGRWRRGGGAMKVILFYLRTQFTNTSHAAESLIKCKNLERETSYPHHLSSLLPFPHSNEANNEVKKTLQVFPLIHLRL